MTREAKQIALGVVTMVIGHLILQHLTGTKQEN